MIKVTFSESPSFSVVFGTNSETFSPAFDEFIEVPVVDYYDGDYEIEPTAEAQVVPVIGKTARKNITVKPIPSNYGLITWNGSTLTVS